MEQVHKDCIRKNLVMLCEKLTAEPLHSHLIQDGVFNDISMQYIKAPRVPFEQNQKLCLDLMKKGPKAFDKFVVCLFKSNLESIAERLIVCEYNFRHRASFSTFDQLPAAARQKYASFISNQQSYIPVDYPPAGDYIARRVQAAVMTSRSAVERLQGSHNLPQQSIVTYPQDDPHNRQAGMILPGVRIGGYDEAVLKEVENVYPMDSSPRGLMLIINNKDFPRFPEKSQERKGTNIDADKLKGMFIHFGYHVIRKDNRMAEEMEGDIYNFKDMIASREVSSAIVAILTHGKSGANGELIFGTDGRHGGHAEGTIQLSWVFEQFNAKNCRALRNKPKWFIVQACRGTIQDQGEEVADADPYPEPPGSTNTGTLHSAVGATGGANQGAEAQRVHQYIPKIPTEKDCLIAYATFPGYYSWRHTIRGSWFIQGLCEIIEQHVFTEDVLSMLTKVNRKVSSYRDGANMKKQVPQFSSSLDRKWFLNPIPAHMVSS